MKGMCHASLIREIYHLGNKDAIAMAGGPETTAVSDRSAYRRILSRRRVAFAVGNKIYIQLRLSHLPGKNLPHR